jgi:hypothetical protein
MYYRVKILSKEAVRFPPKREYDNINAELGLLFEDAGIAAYDLVEKYVPDAFESEDLEDFMQNLQLFAKRAEPDEVHFFMALLTDGNWDQLKKSPRFLSPDVMENSAAYWFLHNILAVSAPKLVSPIDALCLKVQVLGNGEDELLTKDDTGKYGEIYPFATRLLMDASAPKKEIGDYELKGPIVEYFEGMKGTKLKSVPSDEAYDFDKFVDDTGGIVWSASVLRDPVEDAEEGEEMAIYEILVHPDWLGAEIKTDFETFPYSDYAS